MRAHLLGGLLLFAPLAPEDALLLRGHLVAVDLGEDRVPVWPDLHVHQIDPL